MSNIPNSHKVFFYPEKYEGRLKELGAGDLLVTPSGRCCKGSYGRVVLCNVPDAVLKLQSPRNQISQKLQGWCSQSAEMEQAILRKATKDGAPHIPPLIESFEVTGQRYALLMKKTSIDLQEIFSQDDTLSNECCSLEFLETVAKTKLEALDYLHKNKIGMFDVNPKNCSKKELFDFGFSSPFPLNGRERTVCSRPFRPPEAILRLFYTGKVDMWSLGVMLFELFTRTWFCDPGDEQGAQTDIDHLTIIKIRLNLQKFPREMCEQSPLKSDLFDRNMDLKRSTRKEKRTWLQIIRDTHKEPNDRLDLFIGLLSQMLQFDPKNRISAEDALKHPFFTSPTSTDLAFKIQIQGINNYALRFFKEDGTLVKTINLPTLHKGSCLHMPRAPSYKVEIASLSKAEEAPHSCELSIAERQTLLVNTETHSIT